MPWDVVHELLGPGLQWGKSQEKLIAAIAEAERRGEIEAAEHIRIILARRNLVMFETPVQRAESSR